MTGEEYFPPPEEDGGWRIGDPHELGVNVDLLNKAISYHVDNEESTKKYGGALARAMRNITGEMVGPYVYDCARDREMRTIQMKID